MKVDKYTWRRFDIQTEEAIDLAVLEATPFDYPGSATEVVYETEEFTFVCPWIGLPDFARLVIRYTPNRSLVELKSLKYYLTSYRSVGISLEPISMILEVDYKVRGGLRTRAVAKYDRESTELT